MAADEVGYRFTVSGKVQGVFFRASAAREAARLGIRGHAINLADGRVEVLAIGTAAAVEDLRRWLHRGPPAARVRGVESRPEPEATTTGVRGFRTG
jgi:acylphosphatase